MHVTPQIEFQGAQGFQNPLNSSNCSGFFSLSNCEVLPSSALGMTLKALTIALALDSTTKAYPEKVLLTELNIFCHGSCKWKINLELGVWGQKTNGGTISWGGWKSPHTIVSE